MKKKERFLRNWNEFNELILPELNKKYEVSKHDWMFKIRTAKTIYNYYPKGERLEVQNLNYKSNTWCDMTLKEFEENFVCITAQ